MVYNLDKSEFQLFNLFHRSFLGGGFFQICFLNVHPDPWGRFCHPSWGLHILPRGLVKKTTKRFSYTKKTAVSHPPKKIHHHRRHFPPLPLQATCSHESILRIWSAGIFFVGFHVWLFVWGWWVGTSSKRTWRDVGFDVWVFVGRCYRIPCVPGSF